MVEAVGDPLTSHHGTAVEFGGGPPRWTVGVGVLAAVAALLAAGAVLGPGGDDTGSTTATSTPPTSSPATTAAAPPSTAARTTSTDPPPPSVALPTPAAGRLLLDVGRRTLAVDLASGAATWLDGTFDTGAGSTVVQLGDALVGSSQGVLRSVPLDGTPTRPFRADGSFRIWGQPGDVGTAWVEAARPDAVAVQQVSARGDNLGTAVEIPSGAYVLTFADGSFTLGTGDRLYRWDPASGAIEALDLPGVVTVADGAWGLVQRCDDQLRCSRFLADLRSGAAERLPGPLGEPASAALTAVSRNGRFVAEVVAGDNDGRPTMLRLLDRTTGVTRQVRSPAPRSGGVIGMDPVESLAFTADSGVLFFVTGTRLSAWVLTSPDPVAVEVGGLPVYRLTVVPVA